MGYPKKNMRQQLHIDKEKIPNISSQLFAGAIGHISVRFQDIAVLFLLHKSKYGDPSAGISCCI